MALIQCKECDEPVSTQASTCPHCGAPQTSLPLPAQPPIIEPQRNVKEEQIYADGIVTVTTARVIIGGTTYVSRNVTSVKILFTPPRLVKPILLLVMGLIILLVAFAELNGNAPAPIGIYILAGAMIGGAILWMLNVKTMYHVCLSSASGEIHALTSKDKAYIERVVLSINEAIVKHQ